MASGVVPSSFRILRSLLSRLEDEATGAFRVPEFYVQIPPGRIEEAKAAAASLGDEVKAAYPLLPGMRAMSEDPAELILNRTWRPTLSVTGLEGAPAIVDAGNVLRPATAAKLSVRLPPTLDAEAASRRLKALFEADPPYGAKVTFEPEAAGAGWNAPPLAPWLRAAIDRASQAAFGQDAALTGEGGSIPFMGMLGEKFPAAQFMITGVLGPHSNAHGPNEFLHVGMGKAVTLAVAQVLADHRARD
jgi:acetylornithine deacetylase/succinyl-diaminopimelate desuccinylase-like protein